MNINEFRQKYPQYNDMPDEQLARSLHAKHYSDMSYGDFAGRFLKIEDDQIAPGPQRGRIGEAGAAVARTFLDIGKGLTGGIASLSKLSSTGGAASPYSAASRAVLGGKDPIYEKFTEATENILSAKQKMQPTRTGTEGWLINTLAGGGSQLITNIALGSVSLPAVAVNMFATSRQNVLDEGGTELEANLTGLAESALETWGVSRLIKFKSAGAGSARSLISNIRKKLLKQAGGDLKNIGTNALKSALVEGLEEASQSGASLAISALPGGIDIPKKKDGSPDWGAMLSQVGQEAAGGALLGALVPGGMNVAGETVQMAQEVTPERRQRTIDIVHKSNLNEVQKARMLRTLGVRGEVTPTVAAAPVEKGITAGIPNIIISEFERMANEPITKRDLVNVRSFLKDPIGMLEIKGVVFHKEGDTIYAETTEAIGKRAISYWRNQEGDLVVETPEGKRVFHKEKLYANELSQPPTQATVQNNPEVSPKSLETVDRLADNLAQLEPRRKQLDKEMKSRKAAQAAKEERALQELIDKGVDPIDAAKMSQAAGRGMLKSLVPEVREGMTRDDQVTLQRLINEDKRISQFERDKLNNVMKAIFDDRVQPSRSEIKAFDKFFGTDIVQMGKKYAPKWLKALRFAWDATTKVPRAFVCSFDNSFAGVQAGLFAGSKHPKVFFRDITQGLKMLASEEYTNLIQIEIRTNPRYEQAIRDNLPIEGKEEYFQSDLAHRVPFLGWIPKVSDRAFSTTAHKLRLDYYNLDMDANQEMEQNAGWRRKIADHLANITGAGKFPGKGTRVGDFLNEAANAALWSPKLYIGAAKTWTDMISKPGIRKMAAADLIRGLGVGFAILALAKLMFKDEVEIELNPESSDAFKIKRGNTRINFFGQHQQIARLAAQLATGKTKSTATGRISDVKRLDIVKRYLRFKLNPAMSVPVDIATGTTALGERMRGEPEFIAEYAANHLAPLFLQDMVDAVRFQGWGTAMAIAPAAFHGVGAQTYEKSARVELADLRNYYAHQTFGVDWDQLGPDYQQAIRDARPVLDEYQRKTNIEAEDFNYHSRLQSEQREAGRRIRKALPKKVQNIFEDLGINTSISKRISSNWWLTDERSEHYEREVVRLLKQSVPEIINKPEWKTLDRNMQLEYLQGVVNAAKDYVRSEIVNAANIEDYQRVQIEELPE